MDLKVREIERVHRDTQREDLKTLIEFYKSEGLQDSDEYREAQSDYIQLLKERVKRPVNSVADAASSFDESKKSKGTALAFVSP